MSCIQTATLTVNILVGDAVVWWRASMLWMGRSRSTILALCAILLMSTFAISIADTCGACQLDLVREEAGYGQLFSGDRFGAAASILSLVTNAVATALTAYKGWQHARLLRKYFSDGSMGTNVERVVILLVESGMVYSAIWLVVTVYQLGVNTGDNYTTSTNADRPDFWTVIGYFVNGALVPVIAIYPMAIIVLVAMKKSQMARAHSFSTHAQASPSATLRFAASHSSSTTRGPSRDADHLGIKMLDRTPQDTVEETKRRVDDEA
ncbi:hypothetical protein C8Q80DRAFT_829161 [Daedaleopsis nitida]|nr:hypothetical protein C8Q80DRAFT_829161 [Daedaleopsis nitida]